MRKSLVNNMTAYLFLLPSLIAFAIFTLYPVIFGFILSFTDNKAVNAPLSFVGLKNYINLLKDDYFITSLLNNIFYMLTFTPLVILVALFFAILLNEAIFCRKFFRTIFFFPYISSMVSVAIIWNIIFSPQGPINRFLMAFGVENPPQWLISVDLALFSVVLVSVWKEFGFYMVILLAGLQGINTELYEAARIDGANLWQRLKSITLPLLTPTIFLTVIMALINSFQVFDLVKVMTEGGPGTATNVLVFRIYQEGFVNVKTGYASAIAFVLFFIILIITLVQMRLQKKWVTYN